MYGEKSIAYTWFFATSSVSRIEQVRSTFDCLVSVTSKNFVEGKTDEEERIFCPAIKNVTAHRLFPWFVIPGQCKFFVYFCLREGIDFREKSDIITVESKVMAEKEG